MNPTNTFNVATRNHRRRGLLLTVAISLFPFCIPSGSETAFSQDIVSKPPASVAAQEIAFQKYFSEIELLLCFQGKGSCLPYDAGVLHEAYQRLPALRNNRTIVAGNSSGSIPAAALLARNAGRGGHGSLSSPNTP